MATARWLVERLGRLSRWERVFLLGLAVWVVLRLTSPGSALAILFTFVLSLLGLALLLGAARRAIAKSVWRLRNRLITAYLFIALVPVLLIVMLTGLTTWWITGQIAGYLVDSELNRRTAALARPAQQLARMTAERRAEMGRGLTPFLGGHFPKLEVTIREAGEELHIPADSKLPPLPPGWGDVHGLVMKDGTVYGWAHASHEGVDVVIAAPLDREFLSNLVPGLGSVSLFTTSGSDGKTAAGPKLNIGGKGRREGTPPAYNAADIAATGYYPVPIEVWDKPGRIENGALIVQTRTSAVLGRVFGHNVVGGNMMEWGEFIWWAFLAISFLFLAVELASLVIGISLTRTITTAVDQLYQGTQRVMEGAFSHRIRVSGNDQLAELGVSFNTMTANLERLIVVAKEKERLQSEIEIAREVQSQLFPKSPPDLRSLEVTGLCNPARMVSGDYYDFMRLPDSTLAFAIGDVAGKGISAALLMAAIQSTMRTQLNAGVPASVTAGTAGWHNRVSTAQLVSTLNKQLFANTSPEKYATFYFGLYDDDSGDLLYTNAGHLQPILVRRSSPQLLDVTGTVVGAFPFAEYGEQHIQLMRGDLLVAYTDGIVEPENEYGEMFGDQRLTDLLVKHSGCEGAEVIAHVMEAVHEWTGEGELQDDMTMLVARRI